MLICGHPVVPGDAAGPTGIVPPLSLETTPPPMRHLRLRPDGHYSLEPPAWVLSQAGRVRSVGVENPERLRYELAQSLAAADVLDPMFGHAVLKRAPFVWRSFFAGALVTVGREGDDGILIGFHHPMSDVSLVMRWLDAPTTSGQPAGPRGRLVTTAMMPGERLRGGDVPESFRPGWLRPGDDVVAVLVGETQRTLDGFYAVDRSDVKTRDALFTVSELEHTVASARVADHVGAMFFADEEPFLTPVARLRRAIHHDSAEAVAKAYPSLSKVFASRLNALGPAVRQQFTLLGFVPMRSGALVTFGPSGGARWLLVGQFDRGTTGSPVLSDIALIDLVQPVPSTGAAR